MGYKVLDVSRYIINFCNREEYLISNLKLQKLLYFVQAYYLGLSEEQKPCFEEDFEAWAFGPVVPEVYQEYRKYGSGNIPEIIEYIEYGDNFFDVKKVKYRENIIDDKDKEQINSVIDMFADYSATRLVEISHRQSPWKDAYVEGMNNIITKESIKEFFSKDE